MKTELRSRGDYPFKGINVFQYLTLTLCYNNLCFEVEPQYIYIYIHISVCYYLLGHNFCWHPVSSVLSPKQVLPK